MIKKQRIEMKTVKRALYTKCLDMLILKIENLEAMITSISESKKNETKSSAGDKFETGRAMMQMEEDKVTAQLENAKHTYNKLVHLNINQQTETICIGSLVKTTQRHYFLSVSLGKVLIEGVPYFCLSPDSPIGQQLQTKTIGDVIEFRGVKDEILEIL